MMIERPNIPGRFWTPEIELLNSIDTWLYQQFAFNVAKEAARLGLIDEDAYREYITGMMSVTRDLFLNSENNSSHSEESE